MRWNRLLYFHRFPAFLINLSVIFTQVLPPAWALRPEMDKAGLEEVLTRGAPPTSGLDLNLWMRRLASDPIWTRQAPGWNPNAPFEQEAEAVRRLDALFAKYQEELRGFRNWTQVIAALLVPQDGQIRKLLDKGDPGTPWCPACAAYVTRHHHRGQVLEVSPDALAFDEALMTVRHAIEHREVRPPGANGEATLDLNDMRTLMQARGRLSHGVKLAPTGGVAMMRQVIDLLQNNPGQVQAVTVSVQREGMSHALTFYATAQGEIRLLDRDTVYGVTARDQGMRFQGEEETPFHLAAFVRMNPPSNPTVLVESLLTESDLEEQLPTGARLAPKDQLEKITVCCGVAGVLVARPEWASGEMGRAFDVARKTPAVFADWIQNSSNPEEIMDRVLGREEVLGDDNYGVAELFEVPLLTESVPQEVLGAIRKEQEDGYERATLVYGEDGQHPTALRFFGSSRGSGGLTANLGLRDRKMQNSAERWIGLLYGKNVRIERDKRTGDWYIYPKDREGLLNWVRLLGVWGHDRYATKGGYGSENAHHWFWRGFTLDHNGDVEVFDVIRPVLEALEEWFEGTTDSEVVLHLLGDLAQEKDTGGRPTGKYAKSHVAGLRLLRVLEAIEALKQATNILYTGSAAEKQVIKKTLEDLGFNPSKFTQPDPKAWVVSKGIAQFIRDAIRRPERYDVVPGWPELPFLAQVFYRALKEAGHHERASVFGTEREGRFSGKGNNLTFNIRSIHDDNSLTIIRGIPTSTASYLVWGYDKDRKLDRIIATSERYGAAPEKGVGRAVQEPLVVVPGVIQMVSGEIDAHTMEEWSVVVAGPDLAVTEYGAFAGKSGAVQPKTQRVRWNDILDIKTYLGQPAYVWEYRMGGRSLRHTLNQQFPGKRTSNLMESLSLDYPDLTGNGRRGLFGIGGTPAKKLVVFGTGSSYNAIESVQALHGQFYYIDQSDRVRTKWPPFIDHDTVVIVVSQSGSTGVATDVGRQAIDAGATVIALTNVEGSPLYELGLKSGGTIAMQFTIEQSLASTGTNDGQQGDLSQVEKDREAALAPESVQLEKWEEAIAHLAKLRALATTEVNGQVVPGQLDQVIADVDHRLGNPDVHPGVQAAFDYIQRESDRVSGQKGSPFQFRRVNIFVTANGAPEEAAMLEFGIKGSEEVRLPYTRLPLNVLLENGYMAAAGHRPWWVSPIHYGATLGAVQANLDRHTDGRLPRFRELPSDLSSVTEIVLIGNGIDLPALKLVVEKFKTTSTVPLRFISYENALSSEPLTPKPGALVIAVQPVTSTEVGYLKKLNQKEQRQVVVVNAPSRGQTTGIRDFYPHLVQVEGDRSVVLLGYTTVLELLFLEIGRRRSELTEKQVLQEAQRLRAQVEGIRGVNQSMEGDSKHGNQKTIHRLLDYIRARGWENFATWVLGKGELEAVSDAFAPDLAAAIGRTVISNDPNVLSHGLYGGKHFGDLDIVHMPPRGTPSYEDTKKKVIDEVPSRSANFPGGLWWEKEPGMILAIARGEDVEDEDSDRTIRRLTDEDYAHLRKMRSEGIDRDKQMDTYRADLVLTTPTGGELERIVLGWHLVDELAFAHADDLNGKDTEGQDKMRNGNLLIVLPSGNTSRWPEESKMYEDLRQRYPSGENFILAVTPGKKGDLPPGWADAAIQVPRGEPLLLTKVGQVLAFLLAEVRFRNRNQWIAGLYRDLKKELDKAENVFAPFDNSERPFLRDPAEIIGTYVIQPKRTEEDLTRTQKTIQAVHAFEQTFEGGKYTGENAIADQVLLAESRENLFVPSLIGLRDTDAMLRAEMDRVWRLAKVVTNFGGIVMAPVSRRAVPLTVVGVKMGDPRTAEQIADEWASSIGPKLSDDLDAVATLRGILGLTSIGVSEEGVVKQYIRQATTVLLELRDEIRQKHPTLSEDTVLAIHLGEPAFVHRRDGVLGIDVHFLLSPALARMQLEDEALHELLSEPGPGTSVSLQGAPWQAAVEAYNLAEQVHLFESLPESERKGVIDFLQDPKNPVDTSGAFRGFLEHAVHREFFRERFIQALLYVSSPEAPYSDEIRHAAASLLGWQDVLALYSYLATTYQGAPQGKPTLHVELTDRTGLEEAQTQSPLTLALPDRFKDVDVVGRIRRAREGGSFFLRTVGQRLRENVKRLPRRPLWSFSDDRPLYEDEKESLVKQGVTAEDWSKVNVHPEFGVVEISKIRNVTLRGHVRLGLLRRDVEVEGVVLPSGIQDTVLIDTTVADNVRLVDNQAIVESFIGEGAYLGGNHFIHRYVIGEDAVVYDNGKVTAEPGTTFGLGAVIPVGPETGGRQVKVYPEMRLEDVVRLARFRGDRALQELYAAELVGYLGAAEADFGYIGKGATLSGSHRVENLFLNDGAVYRAVPISRNVIVLSAADDLIAAQGLAHNSQEAVKLQESEQTRVIGAQLLKNAILQPGVAVESGAMVTGTSDENGVFLLEHSHAEQHAKVKDSVIGPNTGVAEGEVTSSLLGPFIGLHHSSIVIGVDWAEGMGNVGAEAAIGSNHTSRLPDQELRAGEGTFFGLQTSIKFPGNFTEAPYSILATSVVALPERVKMPFSLINTPSVQIPGLSPEYMEIFPASVWSDNAYKPMRDEGKYAARDHAKRHHLGMNDLQRYPYEILRPSVVNAMIRARETLEKVDPVRKATVTYIKEETGDFFAPGERTVQYYTEEQIPEIGKNFMTEKSRVNGIEAYNFMIQYYALKGLLAEVRKRIDSGRVKEVAPLLTTPSNDLRWEHERRVLISESPHLFEPRERIPREEQEQVSKISALLLLLPGMQEELAKRVQASKEKDDKRGVRILDDYEEAHTPADRDKFVKQTWEAAESMEWQVTQLLAQLAPAGLEEAGRPGAVPSVTRSSTVPMQTVITPVGAAFTRTSAGPVVETWTSLKEQIYLLPSAQVVPSGIGIVAGSQADVSGLGLAIGAAISSKTAIPVVFIVKTTEEADALRKELGVSPNLIYLVGSEGYPDFDAAYDKAFGWLVEVFKIAPDQIVDLGARSAISSLAQEILSNLGIRLSAGVLRLWNQAIDRARELIESA